MYPVYTHRVVFKEADPVDNSMDFKIFVNKLISDSNVLGVFFQKLLWVFFFFFFPLVSLSLSDVVTTDLLSAKVRLCVKDRLYITSAVNKVK